MRSRARLQYELAQQPRLLAFMPFSLMDLLQLALESHRYALDIKQNNPDLLLYASLPSPILNVVLTLASNTAQLLTSFVEAATELRHPLSSQIDGLRLLQEALELFQRCLTLQEYQLTQSEEDHVSSTERPYVNDKSENHTTSEEAWATILEPVTHGSLVDTMVAQLDTLTTICSLVIPQGSDDLRWIEKYYRMLKEKLTCLRDTERVQEECLANAKFMAAFADASFRRGQLDILEYERKLAAAFDASLDLTNHPEGLCDQADAEITFNTSIRVSAQLSTQLSETDSTRLNEIRWGHITKALDGLTAASKLPNAENLPRIYLRRGDCELLRYRLGHGPHPHGIAAKSAPTLLKNAEVYYRGAAGFARHAGVDEEEWEALVKEAVAASLAGNSMKLQGLWKAKEKAVLEIVMEMQEENLLYGEDVLGQSKQIQVQ
jgi:hypothetical protein